MGKVWRAGLDTAVLEENAKLLVVLESPFSAFAYARATACRLPHHHWVEKVDLHQIETLDSLDNVEIHVTDHPINCSVFLTQDAVFYDPYLWATPKPGEANENHFWVFEFKKALDPEYDCYKILKLHFDFLFQESIPLAQFLGEKHTRYNQLTSEFEAKIDRHMKGISNDVTNK